MEQERQQNEFNNAIGYIIRLDKIFYHIADNKISNNTRSYLECLKLLFHELSTEMKKDEIKEIKEKIRDIQEEMNEMITKKIKIISQQTLYDIEDLELRLRKIYKDSGLMMKMKKGAEWSMEA